VIRKSVNTTLVNRKPSKGAGHIIEDVSFSKGWVRCLCGEEMTIPQYPLHRRAMGIVSK
jgi:hypothetical protein